MNQGKKGQKAEYRKWDVTEEIRILKYMKDQKEIGVEVEKPTAAKYYADLLHKLDIPNASIIQIKNKVKNLKVSYSNANQWANQTGQGVEKGTVEGYIRKLCPHFDALEEIYGDRVSFSLPFYRDTLERDDDQETCNYSNQQNIENFSQNNESIQSVTNNRGDSSVVVAGGKSSVVLDESNISNSSVNYAGSKSSVDCVGSNNIREEAGHDGRHIVVHSRNIPSNSGSIATVSRSIVSNNKGAVSGSVIPNDNHSTSNNISRRIAAVGDDSNSLHVFFPDGGDVDEDGISDQREKITRFKRGLLAPPTSSKGFSTKPKPTGSNAASVMSSVLFQKSEALAEKNKIEQKKAEDDIFFKNQHLQINLEIVKEQNKVEEKRVEENAILKKAKIDLNIEKFNHQREMEKNAMDLQQANIELKKSKIQSKEKLAILELEKQERLEMFKLKLEYEKLKKGGQ